MHPGEDNLSVEVSPVLAPGSWGEYECKASNRLGHASATTSITGAHDDDIYIMVECLYHVTKVIISKVGISSAKLTIYI